MKRIFTFSLFFIASFFPSEAQIYLSSPIPVSPDNTYGYRAPRIALLENNQPVVYWGKPNSDQMYIAFWQGTGFAAPVPINTGGIHVDLWGGGLGPQIATFGNTIFITFEEYGVGIFCIRSIDGGVTFDSPVSVHNFPPGRVGTLPTVSVTSQGNPIVSFVTTNFQEEEAQFELTISNDGGLTFEPAVVPNIAVLSGEVCECCPASIALTANDDIFLAFRNNENNIRDIWVSKSTDGGLTFPEFADIDDTDWEIMSCPSSGPRSIVSNDSLITVFYSSGEGSPKAYVSTLQTTSMQKGQQFTLPTTTGQAQNQNYPSIAGNQDTIGVVWQESQQIGTDVILAYSANGASELANQIIPIATGNLSQNYPDLAFAEGVFHIVYQDQLTQQVWYRQASFEPISSTSSNDFDEIGFQIFPNPASKQLFIQMPHFVENAQVQLFHSTGQLLKTLKFSGKTAAMDISDFGNGSYVMKIQEGARVSSRQFLIVE